MDHIRAPNLLRRGEIIASYLRKGSTLSSGSQPSEVGMGNGGIRRGTPEGVIGTCVRANGGIRRSTPEETISTCECANGNPNCVRRGTLRRG